MARNRYRTGRRPAWKLLIGRHLLGGVHPVLHQHGQRSRSPLPASALIITVPLASRPGRHRPARRRA
ncbi:hypothetical protein ACWDBO_17645 [Streptomyces mirabilis]|uniref:hypothetical protein n=1 Tax=Streptomyces TaxID=1883 RepID=UPI0029AC3477|nr:hypothetical protein [Streptomyces sp. AK02-04a]MDX3759655.1 hypothetical protein [Streptomyces sp. AK02-04a]